MTSPTNGSRPSTPPSTAQPRGGGLTANGFGATTPPDHRTTALQSAVAMLRSRPLAKTPDVMEMANAFLQFLKTSDR